MAECRVGFALINNKKLVSLYKELVFNDGLFLTRKQLSSLFNAFIINSNRNYYIANNAHKYYQKILLVKFILFPNERNNISEDSRKKIEQIFSQYGLCINDFDEGLEEVSLLNKDPESGMFCILDFSSIKGKFFLNSAIFNNSDLKALLRFYNIESLSGDDLYYTNRLIIRFPISEPPLLIITAFKRIKAMLHDISHSFSIEKIETENPNELTINSTMSFFPALQRKAPVADLALIRMIAVDLSNKIEEKFEQLAEILSSYQTYEVIHYEIERCIKTLNNIEKNFDFFEGQLIDSISLMLPSNLPLYSLVIFALIPSFLSQNVYVRPNSVLQEHQVISKIFDELELDAIFPHVKICNVDHAGFETHIKDSSLVVFTGKPSNADKFIKIM